ncbi:hypothetical protein BC835DRAFT_1396517 [Cytidiella melzeri]|nr:hypothetical protein BC835DRAFT_1396517 [Cytidiella melzeri]
MNCTVFMPIASMSNKDIVKSPAFWENNGSVIFIVGNEAFKLNREVMQSPKINAFEIDTTIEEDDFKGTPVITIPEDVANSADFTVFLEEIYSKTQIQHYREPSACGRLCAIIRVTSDRQLQYPDMHAAACTKLGELLQPNIVGALDGEYLDYAEDLLGVVSQYDVKPLQLRKRLLYTVATTTHFEEGPSSHPSLPTELTNLCAKLQDKLIAHFTPILFTVATALHMRCTDVFAEEWMPLVIGPALENSGLCRPIETLRNIQRIEWDKYGLCEECCKEKRGEWEEEIVTVWNKMDGWILDEQT